MLEGTPGADVLSGIGGNDTLAGGGGADTLDGGAGNDSLDGGSGLDSMAGGVGDDTYVVDSLGDVVSEVAGEGIDTVITTVNLTLGNAIENLDIGQGAVHGTQGSGNALGNTLEANDQGNVLDGQAGDDLLRGGLGADTLLGGAGGDTLAGGAGADALAGGAGNDVYVVDNLGDVVSEVNGDGVDTVIAVIDYVMADNIENLDLGAGASKGTGNALDNVIRANDSGDELQGGGGNDQLTGGNGNDKLQGGDGNDLVNAGAGNDEIVGGDGAGDDTYIGGLGTDTVRYTSAITGITVDLTLGTASGNEIGNDKLSEIENIIGGQAGDRLNGSNQANNINGYTGNDTINGYGGADTLLGGLGDDSYYVDLSTDVVTENLNEGTDIVYSSSTAYTLSANVENGRINTGSAANLSGNNLSNTLYAGAGNNVISGGTGTETDAVSYAYASSAVQVSLAIVTAQATGGSGTDTLVNLENLTGSNYNDTLTGSAGNNVLDGGAGIDSMLGGDGSDTYYVLNEGDIVSETNAASTGGSDTVYSYLANYTLGTNVENGRIVTTAAANLTGNSLNNVIYAGAGSNIISGGTGTETDAVSYAYASSAVQVSLAIVTAQATGGSGTDTLVNLENLTGSNYNDTLTGSAGNNVLDGGAGIDSMLGGDGSDTYYVLNEGDIVSETNAASTGGSDTVYSYLANYTLGTNVENGRIVTTAAANLTGNSLNNVIYAGAGNNSLIGGDGIDTLSYYNGLSGSTGVTVSLASSLAQATGGSGSDTIFGFENLIGSSLSDALVGSTGSNNLNGGAGNDTLTGGAGLDLFRFDTALNASTNLDRITDFNVVDDTIQLENAIFTKLASTGALSSGMFVMGTAAADANDYLVYNSSTGALYYDADGSGAGAAVQFATLANLPTMTYADFVVT